MIDMETVKFILMLDTLGGLSAGGIIPLSELEESQEIQDCIYYDDSSYLYNALTGERMYRAISVAFNDEYDEDDNIYWDDYIETKTKYSVTVIVPDDTTEEPYIKVTCGGQTFIILDGECYSK